MKRGNVSSHVRPTSKIPVVIRIRVEGHEPEPMRLVKLYAVPEVGQVFKAVPTRYRKALFSKTLALTHTGEEDGVTIYYCQPAAS